MNRLNPVNNEGGQNVPVRLMRCTYIAVIFCPFYLGASAEGGKVGWCRRPGQLSLASLRGRLIEYQHGNVTSAGWQATLCDPMWHASSRSGVATLRTAIHLLPTRLTGLECRRTPTHAVGLYATNTPVRIGPQTVRKGRSWRWQIVRLSVGYFFEYLLVGDPPTTQQIHILLFSTFGDSEVVSFRIYASWCSPPSCR